MDPQKIWSSPQLPSLPAAAVRLLELSKQANQDMDAVIETIKTDPAVMARILKSANSSFFGFRSEIRSIDRAAPLLGSKVVTSLALGFSLLDDSMAPAPLAAHYKTYWLQSIVQATAAELVSQCADVGCPSESFQTGLLLDIGQLAMLAVLGSRYLPALERMETENLTLTQAERKEYKFDHARIGTKLANLWKLPPNLEAAIEHHHSSVREIVMQGRSPHFDMIKVAAFSAACGDYFCRANKGDALTRMQELGAQFFNFTEPSVEQFLEEVRPRIDESAQLFHMDANGLENPAELMAEANAQLSQLVLAASMESAEAVQRQHEIEKEKEELEEKNEKLQHKALRDQLTGIYNRSFFEEALYSEMRKTQRSPGPIGIIFTDIDFFKKFNDTYGHLFGDEVIKYVAQTLQNGLRGSDVLARYGGEEFVMLIHDASEEVLQKTAERLRKAVESRSVEFEGKTASVTASFGAAVATTTGEDAKLAKDLLACADEALYDSKRAGRNCVHVRQFEKQPSVDDPNEAAASDHDSRTNATSATTAAAASSSEPTGD